MKTLLVFLGLVALLFALPASAQNIRVDGVALTRGGSPAPGASVAVCVNNSGNTATFPCASKVAVCSSTTDSLCQAPNPTSADGLGNYFFYVATGTQYAVQIYGSGLQSKVLPDQTAGGGTLPLSGTAANRPSTPYPFELYGVTDGSNTSDCTSGGGSTPNLCEWTGFAWSAIGVAGFPNPLTYGLGGTNTNNPCVSATSNSVLAFTSSGFACVPYLIANGNGLQIGTVGTGIIDFPCGASSPGNPATGSERVWCNSGTNLLQCLTSAGANCFSGLSMVWPSGTGLVHHTGSNTSWDTPINDAAALTGQSCFAINGSACTFSSPVVTTRTAPGTPDTIQCDSGTTLRDRGNVIDYPGGGPTTTVPDPSDSGCGVGFNFKVIADTAQSFARETSATFDAYDGIKLLSATTSLTINAGGVCTFRASTTSKYKVDCSPGSLATGTPSSTTFLAGNDVWATPSGSGTVSAGTANGDAYYTGSTTVGSDTPATANGRYYVIHDISGGVSVPPTQVLGGIAVNTPATPYTMLYSDRATYQRLTGGSTFTFTLCQITGNCASNLPFLVQNGNSGNLTLTANAADKIDNSATGGSATVIPNFAVWVYQDASSAPGNWWTVKVPTYNAFGSTCATAVTWSTATGFGCATANGTDTKLQTGTGTFSASNMACGDANGGVTPCTTTPAGMVLGNGVTATTQTADDNTAKVATTAYVDRMKVRTITFTFGAPEGSALTTTITRYVTVPFGCTVSAFNLLADAGTFTVKFWKVATGTAIPTVSNSISTSGVSLSSGTALHSTTLSDFTTTTVTANDIVAANITAVATAKMVQAQLECDQ